MIICVCLLSNPFLKWSKRNSPRGGSLYFSGVCLPTAPFYSLSITKRGCPRHPLYIRSTIKPQIYGTIRETIVQ